MIAPSLGAIVRAHGAAYQAAHPTTAPQRKAMRAIAACRTPALGGTRQQCARCGFEHIQWHSCRNRHCPRCQSVASHDWLAARQSELLPVPYFHVVFTVPEQLNVLAMHAPAVFYASLIQAAGHALIDVGRTKLHATLGALCVLHTWGQTLPLHPHVHCVVPGGGLAAGDAPWRSVRKPTFLLPVRVLARRFRTLLTTAILDAYRRGTLRLPRHVVANETELATLLARAAALDWVVYAKPPFAGPDAVLAYLARYTHRIAISDRRILRSDDDGVAFRYRDYAHGNAIRTMTLPVGEFLRRFLLHVVPPHFVRIRYYGFLANRVRRANLERVRAQLGPIRSVHCVRPAIEPADPLRCPHCHEGRLAVIAQVAPCAIPEVIDSS